MSTGLLHSLLDAQPSTPAGEPPLKVVMIDRKNIIVNPDNHKIYVIGNVSRLKEDIKTNGIRQPLEVVDLKDGNYKLIGGERRLTACEELAREGDTRFNALPCVILKLKNDDDDKIALITANATARELTDGERLAQYEALKEILTRRKKNGQLEGKVRDELCRILGLSAGAAARLNAIAENCGDDTKRELRAGEITLMAAYKRAQEIIEAKKPPVEPLKPEKMVYEKPVVFDCPPKAAETIPENPDFDEWKLPPECRVAVEKAHRETERSALDSLIHTLSSMHSTDPSLTRKAEQKQEEQQRGRATLLALAEKELAPSGGWEFDRNLWTFKLDFYKKTLPGGAVLWRMDDTQRDAVGLAPGEHTRYAIIYPSGDFFTTGWENYVGVEEKLIQYFELK